MNKEKEDGRFVEWAKNNGLLGEIDSLTWERKAFMAGVAEGSKQLAELQERAEFAEGVCAVDGKLIFDLRNKIEQIEQSAPEPEDLNWQKLYYQSKSDVLNEILENCSGLHHANGSYVLAQIKKMVEAAEACKEPLEESNVPEGWLSAELMPKDDSMDTYIIANDRGQVAPVVRGIVANNVGTKWDWDFGSKVIAYMPMPQPPKELKQ